MGIHARENGVVCMVHVLFVDYVLACRLAAVAPASPEIYDKNEWRFLAEAN